MKKYCMLLLGQLALFSALKAQDNITYTKMADSLLSPISKTQITTGILYDRVAPFASALVCVSRTSSILIISPALSLPAVVGEAESHVHSRTPTTAANPLPWFVSHEPVAF